MYLYFERSLYLHGLDFSEAEDCGVARYPQLLDLPKGSIGGVE
jgi:hypothetical protein